MSDILFYLGVYYAVGIVFSVIIFGVTFIQNPFIFVGHCSLVDVIKTILLNGITWSYQLTVWCYSELRKKFVYFRRN